MRTTVVVAWVMWASVASAAPAVIAAARAEARDAPSEASGVLAELGRGAVVCVVEDGNAPDWIAIRLPDGRLAYIRGGEIDLASAPTGDEPPCSAPVTAPPPPPPPPPPPLFRQRLRPPLVRLASSEPAPIAVTAPPARLAGGAFLPLVPVRFGLGVGTGGATVQEAAAMRQHIGSSGVTLHATAAVTFYDLVAITATAGAAFPGDDASFDQVVVPVTGGDPTTASSSLEVHSATVSIGLRTPYLALWPTHRGHVGGAAYVDYGTATFGGARSISNCEDCREDDLELAPGTFWRVGVDFLIPAASPRVAYAIDASYQRYAADAGMVDEIRVGVIVWMH